MADLAGNLAAVRGRIERACRRAGRDPGEVTLVAVSTTHPPEAVAAAAAAGLLHFGENRVQEARDKIPRCPPGLTWHLVGSLQKNKVRDAARLFSWVHSVDSLELGRAIDCRMPPGEGRMQVLVEVKLSPEETKHGVPPQEARDLVAGLSGLPRLELRGLMTIAPLDGDPEAARGCFRRLAALGREIRDGLGLPSFDQLSMGMSHDLEIAVEEGATLVRVGTALFGGRENGVRAQFPVDNVI
jgi:pyridoxal phosphate enzyme (YggS family)